MRKTKGSRNKLPHSDRGSDGSNTGGNLAAQMELSPHRSEAALTILVNYCDPAQLDPCKKRAVCGTAGPALWRFSVKSPSL